MVIGSRVAWGLAGRGGVRVAVAPAPTHGATTFPASARYAWCESRQAQVIIKVKSKPRGLRWCDVLSEVAIEGPRLEHTIEIALISTDVANNELAPEVDSVGHHGRALHKSHGGRSSWHINVDIVDNMM